MVAKFILEFIYIIYAILVPDLHRWEEKFLFVLVIKILSLKNRYS